MFLYNQLLGLSISIKLPTSLLHHYLGLSLDELMSVQSIIFVNNVYKLDSPQRVIWYIQLQVKIIAQIPEFQKLLVGHIFVYRNQKLSLMMMNNITLTLTTHIKRALLLFIQNFFLNFLFKNKNQVISLLTVKENTVIR